MGARDKRNIIDVDRPNEIFEISTFDVFITKY